MDVRSAVINYIAVHIFRESKTFGVIGTFYILLFTEAGNIATTLVKGDSDCEDATRELQAAVTEFNSALVLLNASIACRTVQKLGRIGEAVEQINERVKGKVSNLQKLILPPGLSIVTSSGGSVSNEKFFDHQSTDIINNDFIVPYQKNEHFTGRKGLLAKLCEKLCVPVPKQYNHRVALYGLGGVGKTQLALEYVYTHKSLHNRIYWISGVDQASLLSGYREIGKRTGCIDAWGDLSPSDMAKSVLSWLNKQENWLLVIDNADDPTVVENYLPERSPTKLTLLTTRNPNADEFSAVAFEVEVLDKDDAVELLSIRSGSLANEKPELKPEAEEIVREVGCLPLAIEQAAAYIREVTKDIFKFLPSYRKNRKRHHNRVLKANSKYGESIASTWHMSFKQVERNNKGASKLLQLLAFLNPDGIYTDFLESGQEGLDPELQAVVGDPDTFYEALSELERFSLIRRQICDGSQRITLHRLVQWVIMDDLDPLERNRIIVQVLQLGLSAFPDPTLLNSSPSTLELSRRYRSQVMVCLHHQDSDYKDCIYVWHRLSMRVAGYLYLDGYYDDCAKLASLTVDVGKTSLGPEHPETLQSMHNLASTYRKLARADEALELFQETLTIRTRVLGPDHFETLQSMHGLGWTYADLAQHRDAAKLHEESLSIRREILGPHHPETLQSMHGLAWAYWRLGQYHEACALHQETLDISKTVLGLEHVDTLLSMDGLGWAQWRLGRYDAAAQSFQDSFDIRKRVQGENHPDTLFSMDGLAWAQWRLGRYQKAFNLFQATFELNKVVLGPEHPDTVMNMYGLANGHLKLGRYTKAAGLFRQAIDVNSRILGPEHPRTLLNSDGLAHCYWSLGEYAKAFDLHKETLECYKRTLGERHTDTTFSLYGMGWAQLSLGHYEEAASIFQERLVICSASLYPDHRDALISKHGLAAIYEKLGRYEDAVALFSETLAKRKEALAPEHPEIMETMDGLASAYRGIGQYQEAIELFKETWEMRKRIFGEDHPDSLQSLYGLAMSYHCVGRCREAEELFIKTLQARDGILGENHPDTLNSKYGLAVCYQVGGRLQKAIELFEEILTMRKSVLGEEHPETVRVRDALNNSRATSEPISSGSFK